MASKHDYPVSPNRELCALGFANLANSFCTGSLQGYGSITRSRLAAATGATTQMASLLTGTFILLVTYFLLGWLVDLPKCILAVIVCVVVFSILEEAPEDVRFFWKMRAWVDGGLMLLTFVLSLFVSVEVRARTCGPDTGGEGSLSPVSAGRNHRLGRALARALRQAVDHDANQDSWPCAWHAGVRAARRRHG